MFAAAHRLADPTLSQRENERIYGKCAAPNGHGHNYVLEVGVAGPLNPASGMVINITDLKQLIEERVLKRVDHKNLNLDVPELRGVNPTVENLAVALWEWLREALAPELALRVRLHETENIWAEYTGHESGA